MPSHYKFKRKVLAQAVAAACLSMAANALAGTGSCLGTSPAATTISTAVTDACGLETGDSVTVTTSGDITVGASNAGAITIDSITVGTTTNSGIISNTYAAGIYLQLGAQAGNILNNVGSSISGQTYGIEATSSNIIAGITNNGTISGTNEDGIYFGTGGGTITGIINNAGATISGGNNGIYFTAGSGQAGGIANSGTISGGTGDGIAVSGITLGALTNSGGGVISGKNAIFLNAGATVESIDNNSRLTGMVNNGIEIGISSSITGAITNATGGVISGQENGIYLSSHSSIGSISNNGTIAGTNGDGIKVWSNSDISGGITNNGTISGDIGIAIHIGSVVSSITNNLDGVIRGTGGIAIDMVGANTSVPMIINNSGLLDGAVTMENSVLNLDGTSSSITGAVTGTSGSIVNVNGVFSTANTFAVDTFNINNGGTLNLAHTITAGTLNNAGMLVIGETAQTVTGNYQQATTGIYKLAASNMSSYGQLTINGIANLPANARINMAVSNTNSLMPGNILAGVLTATTLTATTFNIQDNRLEWRFTGVVAGNSVNLQAVSTGMTTLGNAAIASDYAGAGVVGVARVLDNILSSTFSGVPVGSGLASALDELTNLNSATEVGLALKKFTPVLQGSAAQSTVDIVRNGPTHVVHEMMQDTIGLSSGDAMRSDSHGWIKPFGSRAEQDDRNGVPGYTANSYGLVLGKDNKISEQWKVGTALSYSTSRIGSTNGLQNIGIRTRQIDLYAADYLDEVTTLHLQLAMGANRSVSQRAVYGYIASSNYNSTHTLMNAELERRYQMNGKVTLIPMIGVEYAHIKVNAYAETGASSLNLAVNSQSQNALVLSTGSKMAYKLSDESRLVGNLNVGYDTQAKQAAITSSFSSVGGSTFVTNGIKPSPVVIRSGVSYEVEKANGTEIVTRYGVDTKSGYTNQMLSINWRMLF